MVLFKALVYYFVPLGFIASFYIVMAHHLVLSTRNMPGEAQGQGRQIQARKKVSPPTPWPHSLSLSTNTGSSPKYQCAGEM